ncbi:hypothetical protein NE626_12195 [Intestinimonas massiliensis]|uniref:Phage-Barnase-EndoU-ColicinE5/D-RelE like nuclease 3 domain-containing protein n=1 Tax=Intestinimonas massiliensis (ex Afouda et al. 2020) TaxID=1673721 RepID=A0ABS9MAP0_9FIRM|nr:ADP-ribosyltransferase [Intestinimonas massiliensis (ex Afouda et al. 2020)]MCG4527846.1 hypothetical protein [Intestinimonas massiliensis (ex Afouda et al. 2020)]MCQ4807575.1 hypothetical protein [Intestinimonas massiliensis (ex Afouda et al. 2020)]
MESTFAASSFGASGSRIVTTRTPVSRYGGRGSGDKTEETGGSIYEQLYASGVRSMGDAYFVGGSAAANQAKNVLERGGSNAQALWSGLAAGAAETFFEKFSVDQLLKPKTINNWKNLLTETAKQAGVEASEEMFTEVANILSDAAIMGDSSDFSTAVAGYMAQGMSEEKAKQMAFLDCISRVVWAGAGGALSGGLMGGTVGAWNYAGGQLGGRITANTQETLAAQDGANVQSGTVDTPAPQQAQKTASTGETGYNRIEADSIRHEGKTFRNLVAGIDSSVSAFFEKWRNGRKGRPDEKLEKLYLGRMSEGTRAAVSDILGYEVSERDFIVTNDGVKHILDTHGDPEAEVRKGNLPLTSDIIDALPSVVKNPDNIRPGHAEKSSPYRQGVIFEKMLPDGTVVYIQFDNSKRGTFEGRTLYVKEKESSPSGVDASMETPTSTSKTTEPELSSAPIIADSSAGGNTQSAQAGPESSVGAATAGVTGDEVGESGFHAPSAFRDADLTSAFGENGAKAYRLGWRGDMDEADYYRAFTHAYNAGAAGRSLDSLKDRTLTDAQRGAAFESGRSDADAAARKAGFTTVYGKDSGLVWDDYTRSMDQKVAGQVNEVAKRLGVKVQFADRVAGGAANAKIENGVITIARDAKNPVRAVFGHEITHRIQELAPEEYRAFREAAMAHYENAEDGMVDALVWDQQSRYTKVDQDLSNLDAMDEIAADYAGSLMEDGALLDRFIQANQGKRTLLWKLRDVFRSLADRLTGKYKDQARQAERRLEQALKAAARQAASLQGKAHGATMSETKLSLKNMNEDETAALLQYKSSDSYKVNAKLRDGQRLTEAEQKMVDDLDRALEKLPVHEGTVYRRLSFDMEGQEALDAFLAEHAEGDIVPYEAYTSGSTTQDGYPVQGELTVTQIISSQTGRDMAGIGNNFESEVVFSRNTRFYVEKVEVDVNGKTVIYMEEVVKHGIGQLYSEERVQTVQQMQASAGKDSKLQKVSGVDSGRGADRRGLPGVRGEGNEEVKFSLKGSDQLTREIDRLMKQAQDGTRSEAEVRREIRGLVDEVYQGMVEQYGSIKPGEKPAREVRVPRRTADDRKVSQTVRTILEAKATPDTAVPNIEELTATGAFSYETYTDKAAIADAESTIRDKGYATALAEWSESVGKGEVSKANTATGWALYNAAANAGDLKSAMTVLTKMVGHQRNAAQAVQATRILKSMSPEGQLYGVQRSVGNLQEELKKKYGKNAPDLKIDPNLAENLLKAENQEARDEAAKELFRDIGRQMPSRFMDKWNAWRYLAMLGNSRTHVRNFVGNAFFAPVVAAKSLTATSIEAAVSRVSHGKLERTKGAVGLGKADRALLSSAWADYANVQDSALGGGKYSDFANANQYIEEGRRIFKNKALETFRKGNTKALDAEDVWFSRPHYAYALAQYCKANHITAEQIAAGKGMDKARAYAIKEAQKATYRDTNALSQAISDLGRYRGKGPVGKGISTVMEGVLPFRKTPANILARGLEYSPAGLLKGLTYDLYQVREGNLSGAEAIDHISAGMTGTGLLAFGAYCAAQCLVRGAGGDDKDRKAFAELQGHQNYALELPDGTSITLDWLAPEVLPFFIGVNLWEMTQGEKEPLTLSAILRASANVTEPLLEMSCLQSLNDVFDAVGYASSGDLNGLTAALVTAATSYLTQGVPTVLGQFERTGQEERMTTYTEKNAFLTPDAQYTLGRISGRIPGWDYNQIPHIDAWGRTENTGGAGKRAFDNFANPAYTSEVKSSPMEDELLRLYETTGEKGVFPARAGKYFTVNGERKDLTAEEYVTYATKRGQLSHTLVTELTGSKSYQSMTDEQLVYLIVNARQK